ncbi:hypothetical protein GCM10027199_77170 [Amycolatopsis magusensis]
MGELRSSARATRSAGQRDLPTIGDALAVLGWTADTANEDDAGAALDRLASCLANGPVMIGPVELGHPRYQPGKTGPIGPTTISSHSPRPTTNSGRPSNTSRDRACRRLGIPRWDRRPTKIRCVLPADARIPAILAQQPSQVHDTAANPITPAFAEGEHIARLRHPLPLHLLRRHVGR